MTFPTLPGYPPTPPLPAGRSRPAVRPGGQPGVRTSPSGEAEAFGTSAVGYGVAPPLDQMPTAHSQGPRPNGLLVALGTLALLASLAVPASVALAVGGTAAWCTEYGLENSICGAESTDVQVLLFVSLGVAIAGSILAARAIVNANSLARPVRACIYLAMLAAGLALYVSMAVRGAGVPWFGVF